MMRQMVKDYIYIMINHNMMEIGKMTCRMDLELKNGKMEQFSKEIFKKELKKVWENFNGTTVQNIKDNFNKICLMEKDNIFGLMEKNIEDNGKIMLSMD